METFTEDTFEFRKARIVGGGKWAGVGVMGNYLVTRDNNIQLFSYNDTVNVTVFQNC